MSFHRRRRDYQSVNNSTVMGNVIQTISPRFAPLVAILASAIVVSAIIPIVRSSPEREGDVTASPTVTTSSKESKTFEQWSSSSENYHHTLKDREWVAADFPVTQPYIRSIEVAAGPPEVEKVQLILYDEQQRELRGCEQPIGDWRVKCTFDQPVDVRRHIGRHLYILVKRITPKESVRVYLSKYDTNPDVRSYVSCGPGKKIWECPNPRPQDLNMLIYGWARQDGE